MPKPKTVPNKLLIGFSDEQLAELDKWRRNQEDLPTRSEVVRRLVDDGLQQRPARKKWKGYLRLSLVTCPIALIPATSDANVANAYKGDTGSYIEVSKDELESIALESTRTIDIDEFVPRSEIDPLYVIRPYYIVPDGKVGHDAFAVIRETLRNMDMVAIGRVVLTSREHIIGLEPMGKGLVGNLMRYPYEVRDEREYFDEIQDVKVTKDMLDLAKHIVEKKAGHFEPQKFEHYYERRPIKLSAEKQKGLPVATDRKAGNVIDLVDALKRSLAAETRKARDDNADQKLA